MAFDKVVDSSKLNAAMTATADKIRAKAQTSNPIEWDESNGFADSINTQTKTVTPSTNLQAIRPDAGYVGLSQVNVEAIQPITQATPSITVSSAGLITASATQTAGYVAAGTKSATKQLSTQAAKTVTPSYSSQTAVAAGKYTTGAITVAAIPSTYKNVVMGTFTAAYDGAPSVSVTGIGFKPTRVVIYLSGSFTNEQIENDNVNMVPICATYNVEISAGTRVHQVSREFFETDDGEEYDMPTVSINDAWWIITPTNDGFTIRHDSMYQGMCDITYGYVAIG